jgi:hypothetical protein
MNADEAAENLKTRNPRLLVMLAELCAAVDTAKTATSPGARDRSKRQAIDAWRRIALDTGLDAVMLDGVCRDMETDEDGALDLEAPTMSPRAAWKALASFLNDLRVGLLRTKAGEALIGAAQTAADGRGSLLLKPVTRQGVGAAKEHNVKIAVISLAAMYDAATGCGPLAALSYAVGELGLRAAAHDVLLNVQALKREISDPGGGARRKDENDLAGQYRRMFRLMNRPENRRAIVEVEAQNVAARATIRGSSSPSRA